MTDSAHLLFKPAVWLTDKLRVDRSAVTALAEGRRDQRPLHYFSWKKLFNVIRVEAQLRTRRAKAWGGALEWERDTAKFCQLKFPSCRAGLGTSRRSKGNMRSDVMTDTIGQMKGYCVGPPPLAGVNLS
tara:strand:- start:218 stop:604 length:387 start_codon:yes stop_codon:yes gene_type:complete